jgi:hypothetical protein
MAGRPGELLYFSLVTLSTIGYGDVVPLNAEVRILAALEGITGVLYVAITVALLGFCSSCVVSVRGPDAWGVNNDHPTLQKR